MTPVEMTALVVAELRKQTNLDVLDVDSPAYRKDPDGKAHISAWVIAGLGSPDATQETLDGRRDLIGHTIAVQAVGGDRTRCLVAASKIRAALHGQWIGGVLVQEQDLRGIAPTVDRDVTPAVTYLPMRFDTFAY